MDERIVFRQNFSYLVVKMYKIYSLSTSFNGFFSNALKDKNATDGLMRKISSLSLSLSDTVSHVDFVAGKCMQKMVWNK